MVMSNLVLIRGIPGSGKTTLARTKYPGHVLCEADQYFETSKGYKFDPKYIKEAHDFCFNRVEDLLFAGYNVVVANTFVKKWETEKYLNLPYPTVVEIADGNFNSIHNVPEDVIQRMKDSFEY